jgi:5-methylcytosine-specific restriction protein A
MAVRIGFFRTASQVRESEQAKREYEQRRTRESETRRLYWTARWRAKAKRQLDDEPLCQRCTAEGRVTLATIAHHSEPHRGDVQRFWCVRLESVCKPCHDSEIQAEERAAGLTPGGGQSPGP